MMIDRTGLRRCQTLGAMEVDIAEWLHSLGVERYEKQFRDNAIDLETLPELSGADLEKLGVLLGHRKRMLRAIAALRAEPALLSVPATAAPVSATDAADAR